MNNYIGKLSTFLLSASFVMGCSSASAYPEQVNLKQGRFTGVTDSSSGTNYWLGIPYAQAPVGELRWQVPLAPKASHVRFQADQQGNICPQVSAGEVIGDEDCLNLNIYRPDSRRPLPVLIYIHGGNNQSGRADEFNPQQLAVDINAVVVTMNYRLGALGFNPMAALKTSDAVQASGNFTLLDQARALEWVRNNISHFGGQANNITVSGFSAGGRDVMAMLISPLFAGKFEHAIAFSGGMTTSPVEDSQKVFRREFARLVVEDGIESTQQAAEAWLAQPDQAVKDYLQNLSAERIARLMPRAGIRMSVFPHLYLDGTVLPRQGFDTQRYNEVPTMMLTGHDEFSFFALGDPYFQQQGDWSTDPEMVNAYRFVFRYGGMLYRSFNVAESAQKMAPHFRAPIYAGEFRYGSDPTVVGSQLDNLGSFHGVFLPLLDDKLRQPSFGEAFDTPGAKALGTLFKRHLGAFIRTGHASFTSPVRWNPWNLKREELGQSIYIMDANHNSAIAYRSEPTFTVENVITMIENDHTISEDIKVHLLQNVLNGRWFSQELDEYFGTPTLWEK
ncbi:carboxylesterase family protein [Vibrio mangrovi]|nr:carboxylesterase family protein [Vibrio mangrovi]MDW6001368.1 carboxylesterase family protein [Vibrio mangrovi]